MSRPARTAFCVIHLAALLGILMQSASIGEDQPSARNQRIVFLGDSITQAGAEPGGYVALVKTALGEKKDGGTIEIVGAGISGNRVPDLEKRLERDVLAKDPTLVVIYIGINDVWHSQNGKGTPLPDYEAGLQRIIRQIQDKGAQVLLCTPSVIGEKHDGTNKLDAMLDEYAATSRKVANETKSRLLDLRAAFLAHLKVKNEKNAEKGLLTTDGVHLNAAGNRFVAEQVLAALARKAEKDRVLRHAVLFKFKSEISEAQVQEVVEAFAKLPSKIAEIHDFEWGTDVSVENRADGFTHCFLVTFRDQQGRDVYLPHPAHQEFVKLAGPRIDKVLVFDYWTRR